MEIQSQRQVHRPQCSEGLELAASGRLTSIAADLPAPSQTFGYDTLDRRCCRLEKSVHVPSNTASSSRNPITAR